MALYTPPYKHRSQVMLESRSQTVESHVIRDDHDRRLSLGRSVVLCLTESLGALSYYMQNYAVVRKLASAELTESKRTTSLAIPWTRKSMRCERGRCLKWILEAVRWLDGCTVIPLFIAYNAVEVTIKVYQDRVDEIHGPFRCSGLPEAGGEYRETRVKRGRKELEALRKRVPSAQRPVAGSPAQSWISQSVEVVKDSVRKSRPPPHVQVQHESPLMRLPYELREMIWKHAVIGRKPLPIDRLNFPTDKLVHRHAGLRFDAPSSAAPTLRETLMAVVENGDILALLLTCRAIHGEAVPLLYSRNRFYFKNMSAFIRFNLTVSHTSLSMIREVILLDPLGRGPMQPKVDTLNMVLLHLPGLASITLLVPRGGRWETEVDKAITSLSRFAKSAEHLTVTIEIESARDARRYSGYAWEPDID